ncbi:hypothetical protein Acid7E03_43340 [Acidisoma sp. 7E03]
MPVLLDEIFSGHHLSFKSELKLIIIPTLDITKDDYSIIECPQEALNFLMPEWLFYPAHSYTWSPFFSALNDPVTDKNNATNMFKKVPKICRVHYGVLDDGKQKALFDDIRAIITS